MSVSTKSKSPLQQPSRSQPRPLRRMWKAPRSKAWWIWLVIALALYGAMFFSYLRIVRAPGFHDQPGLGSLSSFGILALALLAIPVTYTLRRRFMRFFPGKAQNWLWMHTWIGIIVVLTVMLHANFDHVLYDYCYSLNCLAPKYGGPIALDGVVLLVGSGIVGRLLDFWQTRVIAQDAATNGVGIAQALEERILALEYTVERLYAGKSAQFQQFCTQALSKESVLTSVNPALPFHEQADAQHACEVLATRERLLQSLRRQNRARFIMRRWRTMHIMCACLALAAIALHLGLLATTVLLRRFHL